MSSPIVCRKLVKTYPAKPDRRDTFVHGVCARMPSGNGCITAIER
jgi:hypothetical protein